MENEINKVLKIWFLVLSSTFTLSCANHAWNQAVKKDTILGYEKFALAHPKSAHEAECKNKLNLLYQNPAKVADKGYTLWSDCMKEEEPKASVIEEKYKKSILINNKENQKAADDIRKEVLAGKKTCEKINSVCVESKNTGSGNSVCSKWKKEKYTDFGCQGYWEGKEKKASARIAEMDRELTVKNRELSNQSEMEIKNQKNASKEECKKHLNPDVFKYYPGIKIFYPEPVSSGEILH
ncbi:MAG: hypothetical protein NT056_05845 [Proteobacteria bacterium]|nr:hypothetical protein [Pseudomonadota bacterium]